MRFFGCLAASALFLAGCGGNPDPLAVEAPAPSLGVGAQAAYTFAYLPTAVGYPRGRARAVNDAGAIVGYLKNLDWAAAGPQLPVRWVGSQITFLALPTGYLYGAAAAINTGGTIAGVGWGAAENAYALRWSPSGFVKVLPTPGFVVASFDPEMGINDNGVVVATVKGSGGAWVPAKWSASGVFSLLPLPTGSSEGAAVAVNNAGDIVGWIRAPNGNRRAWLWRADGSSTQVGGYVYPSEFSYAFDINDNGTIGVVASYLGAHLTLSTLPPYTTNTVVYDGDGYAVSNTGRYVGYQAYKGITYFQGSISSLTGGTAGALNSCGILVGSAVTFPGQSPTKWTKRGCD